MAQDPLDILAARLGIPVPAELLHLALTHPSSLGESGLARERTLRSNQRLEFLGDAVVGLVVAEHLYRTQADLPEGQLTQRKAALVQGRGLARAAQRLELGRFLVLGRGEEASGGRRRESILADAFEAVVGAVFLAHGLPTAAEFVLASLAADLDEASGDVANPKNRLQEHSQAIGLGTPTYRTIGATGAGAPGRFAAEVWLDGQVRGKGSGGSKKEAESRAAEAALAALMPDSSPI